MPFRLMCVTAHPDDESGAFGGALSMAHAQGVETSILCLTEGRAGSYRGEARSDEELGRLRRAEFEAANRVLGVTHSALLNYPDGALREERFETLIEEIVHAIRRWRPQVMLSWGTEGGVNLHADHMVTGLATSAAFHWAGRAAFFARAGEAPYAPQKLYCSSPPFLLPKPDGAERTAARTPHSLVLELGERWKARKVEAFRQHDTQSVLFEKVQHVFEEHAEREFYLLVVSRQPLATVDDDALFAGVQED